jgi:hypothetical protein
MGLKVPAAPDDPATDSVLLYVGPRRKDFKPNNSQATRGRVLACESGLWNVARPLKSRE